MARTGAGIGSWFGLLAAIGPSAEVRQPEVAEGFEIRLFASHPLVSRPVGIRFDAQGRLWVATGDGFDPAAREGPPRDRILVLEDRDGDGRADRSSTYAEGLSHPGGLIPEGDGVYVASGSELLFLRDTDGDLRADERRVVLSGFGAGNARRALHTLRRGPDGHLYMLQGESIRSEVETPGGVRSLRGAGVWRYHPSTGRLEVFSTGPANPRGIAFDSHGEVFLIDNAPGGGIHFSFPGARHPRSGETSRTLPGLLPAGPGLSGLTFLSHPNLSPDWEGLALVHDSRANESRGYRIVPDGSGHAVILPGRVLVRSGDPAFRPVDAAWGPGGALYLADRDDRTDQAGTDPVVGGRVWRLDTGTGLPDHTRMSTPRLLAELPRAPARRALRQRHGHPGAVDELDRAVADWLPVRDGGLSLLSVLRVYQSLDRVRPDLLSLLLEDEDPRIRAAAVRIAGEWSGRMEGDPWLERALADRHPRVRLEALLAWSAMDAPEAFDRIAALADSARDRLLDFALRDALRRQSGHWLPALRGGAMTNVGALAAVIDDPRAVDSLLEAAASHPHLLEIVAHAGNPAQIDRLWGILARGEADPRITERCVRRILDSRRERGISSPPPTDLLRRWIESGSPPLQRAAARTAGEFVLEELGGLLRRREAGEDPGPEVRQEIRRALSRLGGWEGEGLIVVRLAALDDVEREAALASLLVRLNPGLAAFHLVRLARKAPRAPESWMVLVDEFLRVRRVLPMLELSLRNQSIPPAAARAVLLRIESSGRVVPALQERLSELGFPEKDDREPDLDDLAARAMRAGRVGQGKQVWLSARCHRCHSLDGPGPSLEGIGRHADPARILAAILDPSAEVRPGYRTVHLETRAEQVRSGVILWESKEAVALRTAHQGDIVLPQSAIVERTDGFSLMPASLSRTLSRQELLDLVRYLASGSH